MRKQEREAANRQENSKDLLHRKDRKLREDPSINQVSYCIYNDKYDWSLFRDERQHMVERYSNESVSVIAFKRSADAPEPESLRDAMGFIIQRPAF